MEELKVTVDQTPGKIECNFDEIEAALRNQMTAYADLEITEENIPERKADLATLRKIRGAVDDKRKEVKRDFDAPLKEFEGKVKSLTGILDEQIYRIHDGLNVFEQKRIAEKQAHNRELYEREVGGLAEYLPYESIRSDKWNNKTTTDTAIVAEIQEKVLRVNNDLAAIRALGSEIEEKLLATYKASGNQLSVAIQKNTEYMEAKRAAEERLKAEAERKAREEAERKAREEAERTAAEVPAEPVPVAPAACQPAEPVNVWDAMNPPTLTIRVTGLEDIEALRNFLDMSGIRFEEV